MIDLAQYRGRNVSSFIGVRGDSLSLIVDWDERRIELLGTNVCIEMVSVATGTMVEMPRGLLAEPRTLTNLRMAI